MVRTLLLLLATVGAATSFRTIAVTARAQHSPAHPHPASPAPRPAPQQAPGAIIESASRIQQPPSDYKFPVGQNYVYSAEWRLFNAGTANMRFESSGNEARIVMTADTTGAVGLLYRVHDRMESVINPNTFCSQSVKKVTEEGFRRVNTELRFDYQQKKAFFEEKNLKNNSAKHLEGDLPVCATDVIASVFYAGTVPIEPGRQFTFPLNDGGKTVDVVAHAEAREEVKVPAGTYKTIRIQPEVTSGPLRGKGKVWVWYSEDANRIPVQMRARMFWGTLNFRLQRIEMGGK